jgi:hypothetical protein
LTCGLQDDKIIVITHKGGEKMGDTRNGKQKEDIEQIIDYLISEHRDAFELELAQRLSGIEAQLRSDFNRRLELIRKDLSATLKPRLELANRKSEAVDTSSSVARPVAQCDYLT